MSRAEPLFFSNLCINIIGSNEQIEIKNLYIYLKYKTTCTLEKIMLSKHFLFFFLKDIVIIVILFYLILFDIYLILLLLLKILLFFVVVVVVVVTTTSEHFDVAAIFYKDRILEMSNIYIYISVDIYILKPKLFKLSVY